MIVLTLDLTRNLRLRSQRLSAARPAESPDPAGLLRDVCGVQAQEARPAALAVWVRGAGPTAGDLEHARLNDRSVVRTWCMRGTIHLLAADDLGWLLALLGPVFVRNSRRRYAELGLTEAICQRAVDAIGDILSEQGPLSRADLAGRLAEQGIPVEGQAAYHLVRRAGLEGVLCFGPNRGNEPTYVSLESWTQIGDRMEREAALARLARCYLEAFGPAGPKDLATWSGLPVSEAQRAVDVIGPELVEVEIDGSRAWMLDSQSAWLKEVAAARGPVSGAEVRLLPAFDPYLLGYRDRELTVPALYAKRVHPGGGVLRPVVLVDGRAAGTWRTKRRAAELVVTVEPFEPLSKQVVAALEEEVRDLGRFLGTDALLAEMPTF